jgi:hypothetical protein
LKKDKKNKESSSSSSDERKKGEFLFGFGGNIEVKKPTIIKSRNSCQFGSISF